MTTEALGPILQVTNTIDSDGIRPASPGVSVPTKTLEFDATASADASDSNAEHTPSGVQTIQHYELIRRLGEGGMGAVYLARDTKLGRLVAIKLLIEITIVTASHDKTARVWKTNGTGEPIIFKGHEGWVRSVAWSPDGQRIVTASDDKTARVWNADGTGEPIIFKGHENPVVSATWSPDGQSVVTASEDGTARVWKTDGSGENVVFRGHESWVWSASWSPDGTHIVTASVDETARIWLVGIPLLQQTLHHATTDCLTPPERETYLLESESDARTGYEACERSHGLTPFFSATASPTSSAP